MEKFINKFEKIVSHLLMIAVMCYIVFQNISLVWETITSYATRIKQSGLDYTQEYGKNIFIIFFNILLALEVLETVRVFDKEHQIKIRIILLVCLIAISRKILTMNIHDSHPLDDLALSGLVLSLSLGYYLIHNGPASRSLAINKK